MTRIKRTEYSFEVYDNTDGRNRLAGFTGDAPFLIPNEGDVITLSDIKDEIIVENVRHIIACPEDGVLMHTVMVFGERQ